MFIRVLEQGRPGGISIETMLRAFAHRSVNRSIAAGGRNLATFSAVELHCPAATARRDNVLPDERRAASWAVASFLRGQGFSAADATMVQRGSPVFSTKVAALAKEEVASGEAIASVKRLKALCTQLLQDRRIDVAEAVLESLGGSPDWVERHLPFLYDGVDGVTNLLDVVGKLHKIGIERKKMWLLFEHNPLLWKSTALDMEGSVASLKQVDGGKFLMRTIFCCPLLVGVSSQQVLNGLVWELARVGADKKHLYNVLMLFQKNRENPVPVPEVLEQQCGLGKEEIRRRLTCDVLKLATEVNHSLTLSMKWFANEGIREHEFWKLVIQKPAEFCRNTASLDEQMEFWTGWGMSRAEVLQLLVKHSYCVVWNVSIARTKVQYLVETMGFPVSTVLSYPKFLTCSLGLKAMPRHRLLEFLEKEGKIQRPTSLQYLSPSEEAFLETYTKLHPDAARVYAEAKGVATAGDEEQQEDDERKVDVLEAKVDDSAPAPAAGSREGDLLEEGLRIDDGVVLGEDQDLVRAASPTSLRVEQSIKSNSSSSSPTTSDESGEVEQIKQSGATGLDANEVRPEVENGAAATAAAEAEPVVCSAAARSTTPPGENAVPGDVDGGTSKSRGILGFFRRIFS